MKKEELLAIAESFIEVAENLQSLREKDGPQISEIFNYTLRAQLCRDVCEAFRNAAKKLP